MFEKKIAHETETLLQLATEDNGKTYLPDLLENNFLPSSLKKYVSSEIDWWIYEERIQKQLHPNFDTEKPEIIEIFDKLDDLYRKYAVFNYKKLEKLVKSYISVRLNYLIRPRNTLSWFIFRGEPTKPRKEVLMRLDHFTDYPYLLEELRRAYSDGNDDDLVTVSDFGRAIDEIDNDHIYALSPVDFISLLDPLYEFFGDGESGDLEIPVEALIIFLDDKGISPMARSLEKLLRSEHIKLISKAEFAEFIDTILNEIDSVEKRRGADLSEAAIQEPAVEEDQVEPVIESSEEYTDSVELDDSENAMDDITEEIFDEDEDQEVTGDEKIAEEEEDEITTADDLSALSEEVEEIEPIEEDIDGISEIPEEVASEEPDGENGSDQEDELSEADEDEGIDQDNFEQEAIANADSGSFIKVEDAPSPEFLNKEFRIDLPDEEDQPVPVSELKEYSDIISSKLEAKFIDKIFDGDMLDYFKKLDEFEEMDSWREAAAKADELFARKSIDPDSSIARDFHDAIKKRFEKDKN